MWTHIPQTPPTLIGNMVPYPTQPLQYQPCFIPPLQPTNHSMYFNSQVQSYSVVPQQYVPIPTNRGFRQPIGMGQPSNVPYIMHQDFVPVTHTMGGAVPLQPQTHTRPAMYEVSPVQQAQFVPQYSKPPRHISAFVQRRAGIFSQEAYYEHSETNLSHNITCEQRDTPKLPAKSEEQCEMSVGHSLPEEQLAELYKPRIDANTVSASTYEKVQTREHLQLLDNAEGLEADATHSPSETTLVPSPSSSDGIQTVCNSPDSEEEELTATEDDQIPTKDISGANELTLACSSVERLEPEQPYDNAIICTNPSSQEQCDIYSKPKLQTMSSPSLEIRGVEITAHHPTANASVKICNSIADRSNISANQLQQHQQPIRSLIDTPVYNTGHSRVLCQLSHTSGSSRRHDRPTKHPLTTHFRQLFKPIPYSTKKEDKTN